MVTRTPAVPSTTAWPRSGDFEAGGCGQGNPFGEYNRTHVRSGEAEVLGAYCYASCLDCNGDTVGTIIGIEEIQDFIGLEAFPNPAEDVLNVRFDGVDGLACRHPCFRPERKGDPGRDARAWCRAWSSPMARTNSARASTFLRSATGCAAAHCASL